MQKTIGKTHIHTYPTFFCQKLKGHGMPRKSPRCHHIMCRLMLCLHSRVKILHVMGPSVHSLIFDAGARGCPSKKGDLDWRFLGRCGDIQPRSIQYWYLCRIYYIYIYIYYIYYIYYIIYIYYIYYIYIYYIYYIIYIYILYIIYIIYILYGCAICQAIKSH